MTSNQGLLSPATAANAVFPAPITRVAETFEQANPQVPGEIELDLHGRLLHNYLTYEGFAAPLIEAYDHWITNILPRQVAARSIPLSDGGQVVFGRTFLEKPKITPQMVRMTPQMARDSMLTYAADASTDIAYVAPDGTQTPIDRVLIGKLPVMVLSSLCHLHGKTDLEILAMRECSKDPGGYFIIKGTEKVVLIQEKLGLDKPFVFVGDTKVSAKGGKSAKSVPKGRLVARMTTNTLRGSTVVVLKEGKRRNIKLSLHFMGKNKKGDQNTIGVFQAYRMIGTILDELAGITEPNEKFSNTPRMIRLISQFTRPEWVKKVWITLQPSLLKLSLVGDDIEYILRKRGPTPGNTPSERRLALLNLLEEELFPQIEATPRQGERPEETRRRLLIRKLDMLSIMVARMAEVMAGLRPVDDRDDWANKRLETAARSMEQLFHGLWNEYIKKTEETIRNKNYTRETVRSAFIHHSIITDGFTASFNSNNWGVKGYYKENITDVLKRDNILSTYSHLRRVNTPTSRKAKQPLIRLVQMSQLGYICPVETPEGENCLGSREPVLMSNGSFLPMGDVKDGDEIITIDPVTLQQSTTKVYRHFVVKSDKYGKKVVNVSTVDNRSIVVTEDHRFLTLRGWVEAKDLSIATDTVCIWRGPNNCIFTQLQSITEQPPCLVGDFTTVSDNHSFIGGQGFVTHNCGIVKNMTIACYISIQRDENLVLRRVLDESAARPQPYLSDIPTTYHTSKFMLNGKFLGWCPGPELRDFCRTMRRTLVFPKDTSIVLDADNFLYIYTNGARPTRPLLIVDTDGELVIAKKNLWQASTAELLSEGCLEYVDPFEQHSVLIAQSIWDMEAKRNEVFSAQQALQRAEENLTRILERIQAAGAAGATGQIMGDEDDREEAEREVRQAKDTMDTLLRKGSYTHCEMDPSAILGIAASVIPMPEHNQGPRNVFSCIPVTTVVNIDGKCKAIGDLKNGDEVLTIDPVTSQTFKTRIKNHFVINSSDNGKKMYEITTISGRKIQATQDHPFLTLHGWVQTGDLDPAKHHLGIYSDVKPLENNTTGIILSIEEFYQRLEELGCPNISISRHVDELFNLKLLPLHANDNRLPIIARMLGYLQSDGHLGWLEDRPRTAWTFGRPRDAEQFNQDVQALGFNETKICESFGHHTTSGANYHTWTIYKYGGFSALMMALDGVIGRKTETRSNPIPEWIMNGSPLIKREYVAGFMGGDGTKINMSSRQYKTKRGATYDLSRMVQHKVAEHVDSCLAWFEQFTSLLHEFGIATSTIKVFTSDYDPGKRRIELEMPSDRQNLIRLMDLIGYRYATTKYTESLIVSEWLKYVEFTLSHVYALREEVFNLHTEGWSHPKISKHFNIPVHKSQDYYWSRLHGKTMNLPQTAIRLEDWVNMVVAKDRCIFEPIHSIKEVAGCLVADFETEADTHSFIAGDGFISHNCGQGRQALGIYHSNYMTRFDTTSKMLAFPNRPLFEPQINSIMGMNELPTGEMVTVAIMTYLGYNQEDAFIFNKASIDRGLFRMLKTTTYRSALKQTKQFVEEFIRPEIVGGEPTGRYDNIDENGYPRVGAIVKQGDCIIGKVRIYHGTGRTENASVFIGVGEEGIVDDVLITENEEKKPAIKVRIRQMRFPVIGDKFAPRSAQKGTIGIILPEEDMPFIAAGPNAGMKPDIIVNPHCLRGDTLVTMPSGLARRIDSMNQEGGGLVWGWNGKGMVPAHQVAMEPKGKREIVRLTLEDGRTIHCTPDHRFLIKTATGYEWIEAKDLQPMGSMTNGSWQRRVEGSQIVMGFEGVVDEPTPEERVTEMNWSLDVFHMRTPLEREKSMAFARILGAICTDGCVSVPDWTGDEATRESIRTPKEKFVVSETINLGQPGVKAHLGHEMDAVAMAADIALITGTVPNPYFSKGVWVIQLPATLSRIIASLPGMTIGRRSQQPAELPKFLMDPACPVSIIREFLGGLFGGDGHAPHLIDRKTIDGGATFLVSVAFGQTIMKQHSESLQQKMVAITELLDRAGVAGAKVQGPLNMRYTEGSYKPKDVELNPRIEYRVILPETIDFSKRIGFRYCVQKASRLSAANAYWRFRDAVKRQHDQVVKRTFEIYEARRFAHQFTLSMALEQARQELLLEEPPIWEHYSLSSVQDLNNRRASGKADLKQFDYEFFPDAAKFLDEAGCLRWFEEKYVTLRGEEQVETFTLRLLDRRSAGEDIVFDISVASVESFTANGSQCHNCIPSRMTMGMIIEIVASKLAAIQGERVNATAFRPFDIDELRRNLKQYGYNEFGNESMVNGMTGKRFKSQIFIGPCYYQALRHHVQDKIQMRSRGAINPISHQPVGGRARHGGLRFGEMERDSLISHGASSVLRERLCDVSDAYRTVWCQTCGTIAISDTISETYLCRNCKTKANFGTVTIPYAYKLLVHMLNGAGLNMTLGLRRTEG
jgi:DNA-directed RNA polymerase beta subunit/intein/homing endonuclease